MRKTLPLSANPNTSYAKILPIELCSRGRNVRSDKRQENPEVPQPKLAALG
jgi:hypothetical protein